MFLWMGLVFGASDIFSLNQCLFQSKYYQLNFFLIPFKWLIYTFFNPEILNLISAFNSLRYIPFPINSTFTLSLASFRKRFRCIYMIVKI